MTVSQPASEKLVGYLSQLSPDIAVFLVREIEVARSEGRDNPLYELILDAARLVVRKNGRTIERIDTPYRAFCDPFEDLLYTGSAAVACKGRISRRSIKPVWKWLQSVHSPDDISDLIDQLEMRSPLEDGQVNAPDYTELYKRSAEAILTAIARSEHSTKVRQRLEMLIGGRSVLADARNMALAFRRYGLIRKLRATLPHRISDPNPEALAAVFEPLDKCLASLGEHPELAYATVIARFNQPAHALRLARIRTGSNRSGQIQNSSFAPLGKLLLHDIQMAARRVVDAFESAESTALVLYSLADFHARAETFEQELDLDMRSAWGEELSSARRLASEPLEEQLRSATGLLSTLFRPLVEAKGSPIGRKPADDAVAEAQRTMSLYAGCSPFLDQLSVNEAYMQARRDVPARLEALSTLAMGAIRSTIGPDQQMAMSWLTVIVELTKIAIGPEDARLLERAGQVAAQSTGNGGAYSASA